MTQFTDFNDLHQLQGLSAVKGQIERVILSETPHQNSDDTSWPSPEEIPNSLLPVEPFCFELLPATLKPWISDISDRMQCPPDFAAVGAMVALSSVIGRKVVIQPKRQDDWAVVPNLWGGVVGRPGVMKSPALSEAMKPLSMLAGKAIEEHKRALEEHAINEKLAALSAKDAEKRAQKAMEKDPQKAKKILFEASGYEAIEPPQLRRYIVNDATVEALGDVLIGNPWGVLAYRDELSGLLRSLDREGQEGARAFYLQGFDGNQSYTFDRIGRGKNRHIPAVCISLLGGIQPGKLQAYIHDAVSGGAADDGLLQRFGVLVWPDIEPEWRNIDRFPDNTARHQAFEVFERLDAMLPSTNEAGEQVPTIARFDDAAQAQFEDWRHSLEHEIRAGTQHPAFESHLSKYRKLIPALALVIALADGLCVVDEASLARALGWSDYLRSHAARAYAAGTRVDTEAAAALLRRIRSKSLQNDFLVRDVYRQGWAHLGTPEAVKAAAALLCDLNHLRAVVDKQNGGGRPTVRFEINPKTLAG